MGWGSKLIGIGKIAGGAALIGFTGGAGAPAGVGLMASGGQDIVNDIANDKANQSIDKAVATQQQATNQALGLQQQALGNQAQLFQQQQANVSPYVQFGLNGLQAVNTMQGYPAIQLPTIGSGMPSASPAATSTAPPASDVAVPRDGAVRRPEAASPTQTAQANTASSFGGTLGTLGPRVTLRAPTGQTMQFMAGDPAIDQFLARGAQQVA